MGNLNYKNFICDNYYCQSVSFKPEWFSENNWIINYCTDTNKKPYIIDKGTLKLKNIEFTKIILSKKLLINFSDIKSISIPLIFKYNILKLDNKNIDIFLIISNKTFKIEYIDKLIEHKDEILFHIHLNLFKK